MTVNYISRKRFEYFIEYHKETYPFSKFGTSFTKEHFCLTYTLTNIKSNKTTIIKEEVYNDDLNKAYKMVEEIQNKSNFVNWINIDEKLIFQYNLGKL